MRLALLALLLSGCEWVRLPVDTSVNDIDGDGYDSRSDCDDFNDNVHPFAEESCNGVDNNCSGSESDADDASVWYADADADGYGDAASWVSACDEPIGYVENPWDCEDSERDVNPGATEDDCTDPVDYNCDGIPGGWDLDLDGWPSCEDCDDRSAAVSPDAVETCNGLDDDCDGVADEDLAGETWYLDADGDGWGDAESTTAACTRPEGYVADATDCDDTDAELHPDAPERCNDADDDCDGQIDEADRFGTELWYADADGDGYGDIATAVASCEDVAGYVQLTGDCDDTDADVSPGAPELCDETDRNCDGDPESGAIDPSPFYADDDGDEWGDESVVRYSCFAPRGFVAVYGDCDDTDEGTSPDGVEVCGGADEDCDGETDEDGASGAPTWYADADGDGWGDDGDTVAACTTPADRIAVGGDCDDTDPAFHPDALEIDCSDPADYNCDGSSGRDDLDADGWAACEDCDDADVARSPDADETCNAADDDCDGETDEDAVDADSWYPDLDADGFGDPDGIVASCDPPADHIALAGDCDDTDPSVSPDATETCATEDDDDCDGDTNSGATDCDVYYADADADGYGESTDACLCEAEAPYTADNALDCDDTDASVNPDGVEVCGNGLDDDCDRVAAGCGIAGEVELASADTKLVASAASDSFGASLLAPGDLDGDDRADVLVGATGADEAGADAGSVYLFAGPLPSSGSPADADATWTGAAAGDAAGRALAAGDLDGDGIVDLVIGVSADDGGGTDAGAAYLLLGPVGSLGLGSADGRRNGTDASDCAGCALTTIADWDGDGDDELAIGAYRESTESGGAGAVYLLDSAPTGTASLSTATATLIGTTTSDFFGRAVTSADLDGDGLGDVVVGAYGYDSGGANAGSAFVFYGPLSGTIAATSADAECVGAARADNAGFAVVANGDVDADGYDDLWVGAFNNDDAASGAGAVYLVRGPISGTSTLGTDATLLGEGSGDGAGVAIAADDTDGDGYPDLLVGASLEDSAGADAGAVYLVLGGPGL